MSQEVRADFQRRVALSMADYLAQAAERVIARQDPKLIFDFVRDEAGVPVPARLESKAITISNADYLTLHSMLEAYRRSRADV